MTTGAGRRRTSQLAAPKPPVPPVPPVLAALALVAALVLSGCSGGSDPKPDAAGSASASAGRSPAGATPSATGSPAPVAEKPPERAKDAPGTAGQKRFARYVMALWSYGLRTDDAAPLTRLSPAKKPCRGCQAYAASLASRRKQGWTVDLAGVKVTSITTRKVASDTYAKAAVAIPKSDSYNRDGSFRNSNDAHPRATFEVLMHYSKKRYRLLAFTVS